MTCSTRTRTWCRAGLCTLAEAIDSYLWELGFDYAQRQGVIADLAVRTCVPGRDVTSASISVTDPESERPNR